MTFQSILQQKIYLTLKPKNSISVYSGWQLGWALILLAVALGLIAILVYYFVYVFSTAVYSRVIVESPGKDGMNEVYNLD